MTTLNWQQNCNTQNEMHMLIDSVWTNLEKYSNSIRSICSIRANRQSEKKNLIMDFDLFLQNTFYSKGFFSEKFKNGKSRQTPFHLLDYFTTLFLGAEIYDYRSAISYQKCIFRLIFGSAIFRDQKKNCTKRKSEIIDLHLYLSMME